MRIEEEQRQEERKIDIIGVLFDDEWKSFDLRKSSNFSFNRLCLFILLFSLNVDWDES